MNRKPQPEELVTHPKFGNGRVMRHLPDEDLVVCVFEKSGGWDQVPWVQLEPFSEPPTPIPLDDVIVGTAVPVTVIATVHELHEANFGVVSSAYEGSLVSSDAYYTVMIAFNRQEGTDPDIDDVVTDMLFLLREAAAGNIGDPDRPLARAKNISASYTKEFT